MNEPSSILPVTPATDCTGPLTEALREGVRALRRELEEIAVSPLPGAGERPPP